VKRIHEYKRQLMNVLSIIWRDKQLKKMTPEEVKRAVPRVACLAARQPQVGVGFSGRGG